MFSQLFNDSATRTEYGLFNLDKDERVRILGLNKKVEDNNIVQVEFIEDDKWNNMNLSSKIKSYIKSLNSIPVQGEDLNYTKLDNSYLLRQKDTSLLLNLDVKTNPLSKQKSDGIDLITLNEDISDVMLINRYTKSFEYMYNSKDIRLKSIATDIIHYLYETTGFVFGKNKLLSVIDFDAINLPGFKDTLKELSSIENETINSEKFSNFFVSFLSNASKFAFKIDPGKAKYEIKKAEKNRRS